MVWPPSAPTLNSKVPKSYAPGSKGDLSFREALVGKSEPTSQVFEAPKASLA